MESFAQREDRGRYRRRNQARAKASAASAKKRAIVLAKSYTASYFATHPCVDCGEPDAEVLEFDHREPLKKSGHVSRMIADGLKLELNIAEVAKCDVRCCNCHRRKTRKTEWSGEKRAKARRKRAEADESSWLPFPEGD